MEGRGGKPSINIHCVNSELEIIYRRWFRGGNWIYELEDDYMKDLRKIFAEKYTELNILDSPSVIKKCLIDPTPYENHPWFEEWWI